MYLSKKNHVSILFLSVLMLLPTTTRPIDKPAVIACGALLGTVIGVGISYYLNEKSENTYPDEPKAGRFHKLRQYLNTHPTLRTFLVVALGASTGALATYGILRMLPNPKPKDEEDKPDPDKEIPRPRAESPEDRAWWHTLTNQNKFKDEAELQQRNQEWSAEIERHFQGKPDKIKIYKGILKQLFATLKRTIQK